jgi:hypothetical protein
MFKNNEGSASRKRETELLPGEMTESPKAFDSLRMPSVAEMDAQLPSGFSRSKRRGCQLQVGNSARMVRTLVLESDDQGHAGKRWIMSASFELGGIGRLRCLILAEDKDEAVIGGAALAEVGFSAFCAYDVAKKSGTGKRRVDRNETHFPTRCLYSRTLPD